MSSDVYFDFHTPELFYFQKEYNWSKWYSELVKLELGGKESYFVERVSHLSNLSIPNNIDMWELIKEQYNNQLVDRSLISNIITEWKKLYQECQQPEVVFECHPMDMLTSGQIKILLKKYKGNYLVIRTN